MEIPNSNQKLFIVMETIFNESSLCKDIKSKFYPENSFYLSYNCFVLVKHCTKILLIWNLHISYLRAKNPNKKQV